MKYRVWDKENKCYLNTDYTFIRPDGEIEHAFAGNDNSYEVLGMKECRIEMYICDDVEGNELYENSKVSGFYHTDNREAYVKGIIKLINGTPFIATYNGYVFMYKIFDLKLEV